MKPILKSMSTPWVANPRYTQRKCQRLKRKMSKSVNVKETEIEKMSKIEKENVKECKCQRKLNSEKHVGQARPILKIVKQDGSEMPAIKA